EILDGEGDVVQALAALLEECGNRTARLGRFQQLEPDLVDAEEPDAHALVGDVLDAFEHPSESVLIERPLGVDRADRDSDMVDGFDGGHGSLLGRSWVRQARGKTHSSSTRTCPCWTASPTPAWILATLPAVGAVMTVSIFMASRTSRTSLTWMVCP